MSVKKAAPKKKRFSGPFIVETIPAPALKSQNDVAQASPPAQQRGRLVCTIKELRNGEFRREGKCRRDACATYSVVNPHRSPTFYCDGGYGHSDRTFLDFRPRRDRPRCRPKAFEEVLS